MVVGVSGITDRDTEQEVVQSDAEQKLHSTGLQVRRSHKTMKRKSFPLLFFFAGVSFTVDWSEEPSDDNFILLKRSPNRENGSYGQTNN